MAKLIFTSHYMKHALPAHLQHYVKYIATREGVDQIDNTKELLPATENQKKLVQRLVANNASWRANVLLALSKAVLAASMLSLAASTCLVSILQTACPSATTSPAFMYTSVTSPAAFG